MYSGTVYLLTEGKNRFSYSGAFLWNNFPVEMEEVIVFLEVVRAGFKPVR